MTYVALLYSIILSAERRVSSADLTAIAHDLRYAAPRTVLATGNLVFETAALQPAEIETELECAFAKRCGKSVDIIVRTADDWRGLVGANPFLDSDSYGDTTIVRVMRQPVAAEALARLQAKASEEQIAAVADNLWIRFPGKPDKSHLLGHLTKERLGVGTLRNWNTVRRIVTIR